MKRKVLFIINHKLLNRFMQLCIPRVDTSYSREYIFSIICRLKWGRIVKIFESKPKNNADYRCVMISINWNDDENADLKSRLLNGDYINIVHNSSSPQFWRIMESNRNSK